MAVLITESLKGVHRPPFPIRVISTQGSAAVQYNPSADSYFVVKGLVESVKKGEVALIGTDLDLTGTKVGTVIANALREKGAKPVRFSLTAHGYAFLGRFYTEEELKACRELEKLQIEVSRYFKRKHPDKPPTSLSTAVAVKTLAEAPDRFKVPRGTNTASVVTKSLMKGKTLKGALSKLQRLYSKGLIEYPRVDNDLIKEKPFEVYAHKSLTALGYEDEVVSPFEEEELPLTPYTAPLYLSVQRALTPSSISRQYPKAEKAVEGNRVRDGMESYVADCIAVSREYEEFYRSLLFKLHPRAKKYKVKVPESPTQEWFKKLAFFFEREVERERELRTPEEDFLSENSLDFSV